MAQKKVALMEFEGNANIGLYMFANDNFCILGKVVDSKKKKEIEDVLNVPVYNTTVLGTDLIGVFVCGNNDVMIVPEMYDYERKVFEKICKNHEIKLLCIGDWQNTYGNNICVGDGEIILNSDYSKDFVSKLKKKTKYKVYILDHREFKSVGAICKFANSKYYISQEIDRNQIKSFVSKIAGVGTVNSGSNFISSGIVANTNGVLLGSGCSNIEIQNVVETLDYI